MTVYVVLENHTLGYFQNTDTIPTEITMMGILAGSVKLGGFDWKNGDIHYLPSIDKIRLATIEDFDFFRVSTKGYFK